MDNLIPASTTEVQNLIETDLIKFEESYATIQEADEYISLNLISSDKIRIKWESLSNEDKAACLRQSTKNLDGLMYKGVKKSDSQPLEFPRKKMCGYVMAIPRYYQSQDYDNGYLGGLNNNNNDGSKDITMACIENAMCIAYFNTLALSQREVDLRNISREKMGNVDVSYNGPANSRNQSLINAGIYSLKVKSILKNWLSDSRLSAC
jgi:hypothetical protein